MGLGKQHNGSRLALKQFAESCPFLTYQNYFIETIVLIFEVFLVESNIQFNTRSLRVDSVIFYDTPL